MATDLHLMIKNLLSFYDFAGRVIISVGAGGGQFIEYGLVAKKVIAIDNDSTAVNKLRQSIEEKGLTSKFELMCGDFHATQARGDVVLFEFSLHEMNDPAAALQRSRAMAPDTVVFDHSPGSEWAYYIAEDEKVKSSWNAIESCAIRKSIHYDAIQRFATYQELYDKVKPQGQASINRIKRFESARDITIPMKYGIALL